MTDSDFTSMTDLASRQLSGSVIWANDEFFADKACLITPGPAQPSDEFGHRGKVYDGWETRRRRPTDLTVAEAAPEHDSAIVRLGTPGIVHGVVVDTSFFRANYPPEFSVEATASDGYPSPTELAAAEWTTLVECRGAEGDTVNLAAVSDRHRWTHVRLTIYPDGGVARFRVHGEVVPDPRLLGGTVDLAAGLIGGRIAACSNMFYASPANLLLPGRARTMGEGWETARRRQGGNDWVVVELAAPGVVREVEIDTSYFLGNAPGAVTVHGTDARKAAAAPDFSTLDGRWRPILGATRLQPDTPHRFVVAPEEAITHVRVDILPDGGFSRLLVRGEVAPDARAEVVRRWWASLPDTHRAQVTGSWTGRDPNVDELANLLGIWA